jgi:hypothetical protein
MDLSRRRLSDRVTGGTSTYDNPSLVQLAVEDRWDDARPFFYAYVGVETGARR